MASLSVKGVSAIGFPVDTLITPPVGNDYTIPAYVWLGVPHGQVTMTVSPAGEALCMLAGSHLKRASGSFVQVMTVDETRVSA